MDNSSLVELLTDHLKDVYDAEKQLTKALPRMARAARDEELAQGFRQHLEQTQEQARRLERVFEQLGMKARGKPCAGMKGLIQEGQELIEQEEEQALDLSLCAAARKVERYEMVAYESLIDTAQKIKQTEVVNLLRQTFQEEAETEKRLATISKRLMKEVLSGGAREQEMESSRGRSASSNRGRESQKASSRARNGRERASSSARGGTGQNESSRGGKSKGGRNSHLSVTTTDPEEIRQWAEERGGKPACVKGTGGKGDIGMLRIEFPGKPNANEQKLTPISWDDFFGKFEERGLALVYQKQTANGQRSNFNKLISRQGEAKPKTRAAGRRG